MIIFEFLEHPFCITPYPERCENHPYEQFLRYVEQRIITSNDGIISEVLVNNKLTDIFVENWNMVSLDGEKCNRLSLRELAEVHHPPFFTVSILWIPNKRKY